MFGSVNNNFNFFGSGYAGLGIKSKDAKPDVITSLYLGNLTVCRAVVLRRHLTVVL